MTEDYSLGTYSKLAETAEKKQQPVPPAPIAQPRTQNVHDETKQATTTPRYRDTTVSRPHDTTADSGDDYIEVVRKAVKLLGEKAATQPVNCQQKKGNGRICLCAKKKGNHQIEKRNYPNCYYYLVWEYRQS